MAYTAHLALSRRRVVNHAAAAVAAGLAAPSFLHIRSVYAAYPDRPVKIVGANQLKDFVGVCELVPSPNTCSTSKTDVDARYGPHCTFSTLTTQGYQASAQ